MDDYSDIINIEYNGSKRKEKIKPEMRAAQFAPFAALTGFDGVIEEEGRLVDKKIELDESEKEILNGKFKEILLKGIKNIKVTYFLSDEKKQGGEYVTVCDGIKKVDYNNKKIIFNGGTQVYFEDVYDMEY